MNMSKVYFKNFTNKKKISVFLNTFQKRKSPLNTYVSPNAKQSSAVAPSQVKFLLGYFETNTINFNFNKNNKEIIIYFDRLWHNLHVSYLLLPLSYVLNSNDCLDVDATFNACAQPNYPPAETKSPRHPNLDKWVLRCLVMMPCWKGETEGGDQVKYV